MLKIKLSTRFLLIIQYERVYWGTFNYSAVSAGASSSLMRAPITRYAVGAAMKRDENVPITTPSIIANENERMLSPPRMKITARTMNVDTEVFTVRVRQALSESLKLS